MNSGYGNLSFQRQFLYSVPQNSIRLEYCYNCDDPGDRQETRVFFGDIFYCPNYTIGRYVKQVIGHKVLFFMFGLNTLLPEIVIFITFFKILMPLGEGAKLS